MAVLPILYSFRRCPYAMRARLAIASAGFPVELREVVLRDKPQAFLTASPKGTVPVLVLADGTVLEESLDIILHVLGQADPEGLLPGDKDQRAAITAFVERFDGPFKSALDRTKYPNRFPGCDPLAERQNASAILREVDAQLAQGNGYFFDNRLTLAELAVLPFIRQFAFVDKDWFDAQDWPRLARALETFIASERFLSVMDKYPQWVEGKAGAAFP